MSVRLNYRASPRSENCVRKEIKRNREIIAEPVKTVGWVDESISVLECLVWKELKREWVVEWMVKVVLMKGVIWYV